MTGPRYWKNLPADVAAVKLAAGDILSTRTLLGVPGTLDENSVKMTISSTTAIDPVFAAAALTDADFLWIAPNGTYFAAKAPAAAKFVAGGVGTYRVYCTDWSAVTEFGCDGDNVTALDVAVATSLTILHCHENSLTALDVSQNTSLTDLLCNNNSLTTLDISANTLLVYFYCGNNSLTETAVDKILSDLVAAGPLEGAYTLNIGGTNAAPSAAGVINAEALATAGWTVDILA